MSRAIWKFRVPFLRWGVESPSDLPQAPAGAIVRSVGYDSRNNICAWLELDPTAKTVPIPLWAIATGDEIPEHWIYHGTAISPGQIFVFHIYEQPTAKRRIAGA